MKFFELNNVKTVFEKIDDTPRTAIYLYLSANGKQLQNGAHVMLGNLLLQGTNGKNAEQIALELEENGIEVTVDSRIDFLRVSIVCLDEDIEKALKIVNEIMIDSNFKTFDKEVFKFKNDTLASLDSPVTKASDAYYRELFKNHKYGVTNTKILETIDKMTINDVERYHRELLSGRKIVSVATGVKDTDYLSNLITNKLACMKNSFDGDIIEDAVQKNGESLIKIEKNDAKQAQIFQGRVVPGLRSEDCAKLNVLNSLLGGAGLSSRLFVELRDKKGLAYTVRSTYKTLKDGAYFTLYIGTESSNIKKSLQGFQTEIQRLIDEPPSNEELNGAIENLTGRYKYLYTQTNAQIAAVNGWSYINGLSFDYNENLLKEVKKVTSSDIAEMAEKYLSKESVTVVLAPKEFLNF